MEINESHKLPVSQERAWQALNDPQILSASIPGCESLEHSGDGTYDLTLRLSLGPVKARFKGRMTLSDVQAPSAYTLVFEGQGGAAGFGKGSARVRLEPDGEQATTLTYAASAQVGGKIAQIGSRLINGAASKIAGEFFKRFGRQLSGQVQDDQLQGDDGGDENAQALPHEAPQAAQRANPDAQQESAGAVVAEPEPPPQPKDAPGADPLKPNPPTRSKRSWTAWISKS